MTDIDPGVGWSIAVYALLNPLGWVVMFCIAVIVACVLVHGICCELRDRKGAGDRRR